MDGFIFLLFLIFFVLPFIKRINSSAKKSTTKYRDFAKKTSTWGMDHGQVRKKRHQDLHRQDESDVFPEDHAERVRNRDKRDRLELLKMERNIHSKQNKAMTRVSNKSRLDWGVRGENGLTSSKSIIIFLLLFLLAHFILVAFAPELIPGN